MILSKFIVTMIGDQCVMIIGQMKMLMSLADNLGSCLLVTTS